jgi:starch phosphorylase
MKGGLNLSVRDGWWLEGYDGKNGFAVGNEATESQYLDASDAESLYRVLEQQVIPLYYDRDHAGLPRGWVAMMKSSIATLVPEFNSDRMVAEYAQRIYT